MKKSKGKMTKGLSYRIEGMIKNQKYIEKWHSWDKIERDVTQRPKGTLSKINCCWMGLVGMILYLYNFIILCFAIIMD